MNEHDRQRLRELAKRKLEIAHDPVNLERKSSWLAQRSGRPVRPMILAEGHGVHDPLTPFAPQLQCEDEWARGQERGLLSDIWQFEWLQDDHVVEPVMNVAWRVDITRDFGVETVQHTLNEPSTMTSRSWDAPITDIKADFHKLKHRSFSVDRAGSLANKARLEELYAGIMPVRWRKNYWWTMGLTIQIIDLIGLQGLMMAMYDDPEGLHQLMGFLRDDNLALANWLETEGLLTLNNENDYIGSGSMGYTSALPATDYQAGAPVRLRDQWCLVESQETVGVGPEQYEEFIFPYHRDIASRFGQIYYGCCEPINTRWDVVKRVPNLAACSIAPLCNQEIMAEAIGSQYIFSRKPNPTLISTESFDEAQIRQDLRTTLGLAKRHSCRLELIMKDVHTLNNEPQRLARWVALAREESGKLR